MRALIVTAPSRAEVLEVDEPTPGPGELLIEVERVGICGTDVELYTGEMAYVQQGITTYPLQMGHEWAGVVVATGSPEDDGWIGARVTGDTMLGCGRCEVCTGGHQHVCPNRSELGIRGTWAGALAERIVLPTRFAYRIADTVSLAAAAMVEPGGNSLRAAWAAGVEPGQQVLVLGSGTIGLLAAQFALAHGAEVHVGGQRQGSLELARSLGVHRTWTLDELRESPDDRFHAVIEATSLECSPSIAVRLTRPAGRIALIGLSGRASLVDTRDVVLKDITATGILSASPGLAGAIEAYADGSVVPDSLVSEVVGLDEVPARLEGRRGPNAGPGPKVHVDPRLGA